jgi:hypothetical protein
MNACAYLVMFALLPGAVLAAEATVTDVVTLRDGLMLRGYVAKELPKGFLFALEDGTARYVDFSDIATMTKVEAAPPGPRDAEEKESVRQQRDAAELERLQTSYVEAHRGLTLGAQARFGVGIGVNGGGGGGDLAAVAMLSYGAGFVDLRAVAGPIVTLDDTGAAVGLVAGLDVMFQLNRFFSVGAGLQGGAMFSSVGVDGFVEPVVYPLAFRFGARRQFEAGAWAGAALAPGFAYRRADGSRTSAENCMSLSAQPAQACSASALRRQLVAGVRFTWLFL